MSFGYQVLGFGAFPNREDGGYTIENAVWFDASSSDYLSRTPSSAGNRKTWTFSAWVKRGQINSLSGVHLFGADRGSGYGDRITWGNGDTDDRFNATFNDAGSGRLQTEAFFRDPTAWTHFVVVVDTDQGGSYTAANAVKIYINGTLLAASDLDTASYPAEDYETAVNNTAAQMIGARGGSASQFMDGYMAEVIMLDGTAVSDASSFGELNSQGVWVPVDPSGLTFGTNGFYLNFSNANALGLDVSRGATHPGTVDLQISFDGSDEAKSTTDESANSHTVTFEGDAELDTAQYKFSPSSLLLDGTGDYVKCADNADWRLGGGTGDFTLEFFARLASGVTAAVMVGQEQNATTDFWAVYWNNSAGLQFINRTGSTNTIYFAQGSNSLSVETWYHIALVRSGSVFTFYVNGSSVATASDADPITDFSGELRIGHNTGSGAIGVAAFNGHIDEFRLINGGAVYNGNFTALSAAFGAPENKTNNSFTQVSIAQSQQVPDTCTDDANNNIGNYATLSPIDQVQGASVLSEGNLKITGNGNHSSTRSTLQTDGSGKFAWEVTVTSHDTNVVIGLMKSSDQTSGGDVLGNQTNSGWALIKGGDTSSKFDNGDMVADVGASLVNGDVYHFELDNAAGDVFAWRKPSGGSFSALNSGNTITAGAGKTALAGTPVLFAQHVYQNTGATNPNVLTYNFGQTTFEQTPSSGYKAVNTANLPAPTVKNPDDGFALITLEDGDTIEASLASARTGWSSFIDVFRRETDGQDSDVRFSDDSGNSMHFNTNAAAGSEATLSSGVNYSAWSWRVGAAYGCYTAEISHTNGATTNQAHGLGSGAKTAVAKRSDSTGDWYVSHPNMSSANIRFNVQEATTSELVTVDGTNVTLNSSFATGTYRVIVWEQIDGFSAFTNYSHNGSTTDGPYVHLGGLASLVAWRNIDSSNSNDFFSTFPTYSSNGNGNPTDIRYNWREQEKGYSGITIGDVTANGYKMRPSAGSAFGKDADDPMLVWAWGIRPFGGSGVAQARAR